MKIIETQSAVLSNYEVYKHLTDVQARYKSNPDYHSRTVKDFKGQEKRQVGKLNGLNVCLTTLTRYLGAKPSCLTSEHATYNDEAFLELMRRLEKFKLTKSELLMICNWRPKDAMALDVVVEECDSRYQDHQQEEILEIIADVLGKPDEAEGDVDADGEGVE